jgi:hypothetical protein
MVDVARRMFDAGHKPGEIARELRVGRTTVYRHLGTDPASGCVGMFGHQPNLTEHWPQVRGADRVGRLSA